MSEVSWSAYKKMSARQKVRFLVLARQNMATNGNNSAYQEKELELWQLLTPITERNQIQGWTEVAVMIKSIDLRAAKTYYELQYEDMRVERLLKNNNQLVEFSIEQFHLHYFNFLVYIYAIFVLHHLLGEFWDEYDDLESVELFEMHIQGLGGITTHVINHRDYYAKLKDLVLEQVRIIYSEAAKRLGYYDVYISGEQSATFDYVDDKIGKIFSGFAD